MVVVEQLKEASEQALADLVRLSSLLHGDDRPMKLDELEAMVKDPNIVLLVARVGEKIIGMGAIYLIQKIGNRKFYLEDLIVDEQYRGAGVGGKIVRALAQIARERGAASMELMSRITRADAHRFYEKMGFKDKERVVFKLTL